MSMAGGSLTGLLSSSPVDMLDLLQVQRTLEGSAMKRAMFLLLGLLLLSSVCNKSPTGPDGVDKLPQWPMFRHDVRHTGNVNNHPYEGIVGPSGPTVSVKWSYDYGALLVGSPAIAKEGTIYFGAGRFGFGADSVFFALNADGTPKWIFDGLGRGGTRSSAGIASDGTVYCLSSIRTFAFNPDGSLKWRLDGGTEGPSSPAVGPDGTIYFCSSQSLIAIGPDGSRKWQRDGGYNFHHPVVDLEGVIYYNHDGAGSLVAVNPDGSTKWEFVDSNSKFGFDSAVIDGEGSIYFLTSGGTLYCVDSFGKLKWTSAQLGSVNAINVPAIAPDGTIIVADSDSLYGISSAGEMLWQRQISQISSPPLVDAEGNIYVTHPGIPGIEAIITCYSKDGVVRWRFSELASGIITGGTPLGPDGTLFIGFQNKPSFFAIK